MIKKHNISYFLVVSLAAALSQPIFFFLIECLHHVSVGKPLSEVWQSYDRYLTLILLMIGVLVLVTFLSGFGLLIINLLIRKYVKSIIWYKILILIPFYFVLLMVNYILFESDYIYHFLSMCISYTFYVFYFEPNRNIA